MTATKPRVLVIGATGMLGHAMLRYFAAAPDVDVSGSARTAAGVRLLPRELQDRVVLGTDIENQDSLAGLFATVRPSVVINCVGLVKQLSAAKDPLHAVPVNTLFPHRLGRLCAVAGARMVHFSTDCVFSGSKGMYVESDFADADDLYGRSKYLGEPDQPNVVTMRTSMIGHELGGAHSLVEWFLAQAGPVKGFTKAIFSGLPTVELARVVHKHVMPNPDLRGLYHVVADPISKFDLLTLVAKVYGRDIKITPDAAYRIDRSLNGERFAAATGFRADPWPELVRRMHEFH